MVFLENAIDSCPNSLKEYKNANMLEIKTDISGLEWGGCTPEIIRLDEERGSTVCKFKRLDSDSSYPAQLEINLKYGYYDFEKKEYIHLKEFPPVGAAFPEKHRLFPFDSEKKNLADIYHVLC